MTGIAVQLSVAVGLPVLTTEVSVTDPVYSKARLGGKLIKTGETLSTTATCAVVVAEHPLAVDVMVKFVFCRVLGKVLVKLPLIMFPVPLTGNEPMMAVLSLVHEKVVPATPLGFVKVIAKLPPGQMVLATGVAVTLATGFTVIV